MFLFQYDAPRRDRQGFDMGGDVLVMPSFAGWLFGDDECSRPFQRMAAEHVRWLAEPDPSRWMVATVPERVSAAARKREQLGGERIVARFAEVEAVALDLAAELPDNREFSLVVCERAQFGEFAGLMERGMRRAPALEGRCFWAHVRPGTAPAMTDVRLSPAAIAGDALIACEKFLLAAFALRPMRTGAPMRAFLAAAAGGRDPLLARFGKTPEEATFLLFGALGGRDIEEALEAVGGNMASAEANRIRKVLQALPREDPLALLPVGDPATRDLTRLVNDCDEIWQRTVEDMSETDMLDAARESYAEAEALVADAFGRAKVDDDPAFAWVAALALGTGFDHKVDALVGGVPAEML